MDNGEYSRIVNLYYDEVKRFTYTVCKNLQDAEDITQNVFVKLLKAAGDFDGDHHIKRWLFKVAVNECRVLWKTPWKSKVDYFVPERSVVRVDRDEEQDRVLEAILSLKQKYRKTVFLFYYEGYTVKEIAQITDVNESAVLKRLQRAREKIKAQLKININRKEVRENA